MSATEYVRARIDPEIKTEAVNVLGAMGLTVSDACRMMLTRIALEKRLPFGAAEPNEVSRAAIQELAEGGGARFDTADALFEDLGI